MKFFLLLLLLYATGPAMAQTSRMIYFSVDGKVSAKATASYFSTITQNSKDTTLYSVETFFLSGSRKISGSYKVKKFPVAWEKLHEPTFREAIPDGLFQEYYENKQIKFEGVFRQGQGEGKHRRWYESGKLLSEIILINGRDEGKVTSYYENGQINTQYESRSGKADGEFLEYYADGRKKARATFSKGVLVGQVTYFGPDEKEIPQK